MSVLGKAKGMVGPAYGGLQVRKQRVDRLELGKSGACLAAGDDRLVLGANDRGGPKAPQPVADDVRGWLDVLRSKNRERFVCESARLQAGLDRMA